jgi:hypothetical protein
METPMIADVTPIAADEPVMDDRAATEYPLFP